MDAFLAEYLARFKAALEATPWDKVAEVVAVLRGARRSGSTVLAIGNGGSAATASHFAADLAKLAGLRALAPGDSVPWLTALANDAGYENVFAEPVRRLARAGDVLAAFSTSGNSPNVVRAAEVAREIGVRTVAFTGAGGGQLARRAEIVVAVPDGHVGRVEDAHLLIVHLVCYALAENAPGAGG
jgi:D-sedoheptulose 7-phosphate isomerase